MLQLAICDDLSDQLSLISACTRRYFDVHPAVYEITCFERVMDFLDAMEQCGGFDVVLMDICLPGLSGIDAAREIRRRRDRTEIIFLTTSREYAVDAFALHAAHYLVKPFTQSEFDEAMGRALAAFAREQARQITVLSEGGTLHHVAISEIRYIESRAHGQTIHLNSGHLLESRRSLGRLLEELEKVSPGQFISPYKGYIVNLKAVSSIEPRKAVLKSGEEIPLPRGAFREVKEQFFRCVFEQMQPEESK